MDDADRLRAVLKELADHPPEHGSPAWFLVLFTVLFFADRWAGTGSQEFNIEGAEISCDGGPWTPGPWRTGDFADAASRGALLCRPIPRPCMAQVIPFPNIHGGEA